ncbi:MAG TPA: DNA repair protein RecO [Steroidobacteraceae bacterium]|nr:DNA repair protein RecO [Steroidobacteraceae bacterium]
MSARGRRQLEPAWLLHHRAWSDSSRILELFTREHGRVTLFAHGARRPRSPLRAVLRPFAPLLVSWTGRADGGTLTAAEPGEGAVAISGARLLSGYYLNELLLKLLPKEDRHEAVFDAYAASLAALAGGEEAAALRAFERVLLEELGYGLDLARDAGNGQPVEGDRHYLFEPGRGVFAVRDAGRSGEALAGSALLAVARGDFGLPEALRAARGIFGAAIAHCLEGRGLSSRDVMLATRRLGRET